LRLGTIAGISCGQLHGLSDIISIYQFHGCSAAFHWEIGSCLVQLEAFLYLALKNVNGKLQDYLSWPYLNGNHGVLGSTFGQWILVLLLVLIYLCTVGLSSQFKDVLLSRMSSLPTATSLPL
jgi:hypothetical protein